MKLHFALLFGLLWLAAVGRGEDADRFDKIKERLSRAGCARFQFLSVIESDVFDRSDTMTGDACISADGRYLVNLGMDQYLYDLRCLFSYSGDNNQVTIEHVSPEDTFGDEISFLTRLDELYETYPSMTNLCYRLVKRKPQRQNIPDSMILCIRADTLKLDRIEYYDLNEELNRILFLRQEISAACDDSLFIPIYPDSVEYIRLD